MRRLLSTALVLLLCGCQPGADDNSLEGRVAVLQEKAMQDDTAWQLLESLTSEVGPRMAGSKGDEQAVDWAVAQMKRLGFDRVWLEHVDFPLWERHSESGRLLSPEATELDLTALGGTPGTKGPIQGEVVHFASLAGLEAAEPGVLEGRIAFVSAAMRRTRSGAGYGETVPQRSRGPYIAAAKGAIALLIRSVGTDTSDSAPHTGMISGTETGPVVPAAALSNESADTLVTMLEQHDHVSAELELDVGFRGRGVSANVIGEFDGSGDSGEFLLVGGHLDSWDLGTGAHDDGAGVAITMASAALVAGQQQRPARGIRVVLFANEEQGVYGGKAYAFAHANELRLHALGAESDLGAGRIFDVRTRVADSAGGEIERLVGLLEPLGIVLNNTEPATGGADVGQMRKMGMPVVDLRHDASRYFDLHHTRNDTLENVNPDDLRFNVAAWVTFLEWAAGSDVSFGPVAPSE